MAKEKFYTSWMKATDANGQSHYVTIVGRFTQERVDETVSDVIDIIDENGSTSTGVLMTDVKRKVRIFEMARAICDPRDEFNEEYGIELAKKRLKRGEKKDLVGTITSGDITMLNDDMCNILVVNELVYTSKHIDDYIK